MIPNILLIILLFFVLFFAYLLNSEDFYTAGFIMTAVFIFSSLSSLLNLNDWGVTVSYNCALLILTLVSVFCIGDLLGGSRRVFLKNRITDCFNVELDYIQVPANKTVLVVAFMGVTLLLYFRYISRISLLAGNKDGIAKMFVYARYAITNVDYDTSMPFYLGHSLIICRCLAFIYAFIVVYNKMSKVSQKSFMNFLPMFLYLVQCAFSTARIDFIKYIIGIITMVMILRMQINKTNKKITFKTIIYVFAGVFAVFVGFRILGYLTRKSTVRELWNDIFLYSGGSIPAFSYYLDNKPVANDLFGRETLYNIYKVLRNNGFSNIPLYFSTLPFYRNGHLYSTNVYTAFRRLIQDYGLFFSYIIVFFEGLIYGQWTKRVKTNPYVGLELIIFSYMIYPVFLSSIDEQFILNFTAINLIYHLIYFFISYKILIGHKLLIPVENWGGYSG